MSLKELNRTQLRQLKENYYTEKHFSVSYLELSNIEELVSDEEIFNEYENTCFVEEDFF